MMKNDMQERRMIDVHEVSEISVIDVHGGITPGKWKNDAWWQVRGKDQVVACMIDEPGDNRTCMWRRRNKCAACGQGSDDERRLHDGTQPESDLACGQAIWGMHNTVRGKLNPAWIKLDPVQRRSNPMQERPNPVHRRLNPEGNQVRRKGTTCLLGPEE
jgi:hypothetical protein